MKALYLLFFGISLGNIALIGLGALSYNIKYVELVLLVMFFIIFFKGKKKTNFTTKDKVFLASLFSIFVYALMTYYWSPYGASTLAGALAILMGILAYLIGKFILKDTKAYMKANRILLWSIAVQLAYNVLFNLDSSSLSYYFLKDQSSTLMGKSNYISIYIGFIFLYEFISKKKGWKLYSLISSVCLFFTFSKGGFLSVLIGLFLYLLISVLNKNIKKRKLFLSVVLLITIGWFMLAKTVFGVQLMQNIQYTLRTGSSAGRDSLIQSALQSIRNHPFGTGITFENSSHNYILESLTSLGIFFGSAYILLISYPVFKTFNFKIFRYSNETLGLLIAYLSVIIHSLLEIFFFTSPSIIWTIFTLLAIQKSFQENENINLKIEV